VSKKKEYHVAGILIRTYPITVDKTVLAEDEEDALFLAIENSPPGDAHTSDVEWGDGPYIAGPAGDEEE
jgi:hypothetical protein